MTQYLAIADRDPRVLDRVQALIEATAGAILDRRTPSAVGFSLPQDQEDDVRSKLASLGASLERAPTGELIDPIPSATVLRYASRR